MNPERIKIFSGRANPELATEICASLGLTLGDARVKQFSDGEIHLQIQENVRGCDVFVVQPTCIPVERNLMELLLMLDALKRSSAERVTAVLPYYGYGRQDRKDKPRVPISAKLVASLLEKAGADRVMAVDLHAAQIQGFFDVPVDHLFFRPVMIEHFRSLSSDSLMVVSPDAGGVERARSVAKRLNSKLAIIDKRREEANVAEVMNVIGDVQGKDCVIVDDLIDTAGTLVGVCESLLQHGAASVTAAATVLLRFRVGWATGVSEVSSFGFRRCWTSHRAAAPSGMGAAPVQAMPPQGPLISRCGLGSAARGGRRLPPAEVDAFAAHQHAEQGQRERRAEDRQHR
jgi:ribose-phosphate pyrophosphokinase